LGLPNCPTSLGQNNFPPSNMLFHLFQLSYNSLRNFIKYWFYSTLLNTPTVRSWEVYLFDRRRTQQYSFRPISGIFTLKMLKQHVWSVFM
jgi:hypothetical protein